VNSVIVITIIVPLLRGAVVGLGLGLQDIYGIKNIILHSVNNFLLPMINSVNVKNNNIIKINNIMEI
jgi:hypothetical protein